MIKHQDDDYLNHLQAIADGDVAGLFVAQKSYGSSWKKRGGANTFFMLCRKFDRLDLAVEKHHHDIFAAAEADQRSEGIIDDIRDLRRYLMLVEAELRARGINPSHRDNLTVNRIAVKDITQLEGDATSAYVDQG